MRRPRLVAALAVLLAACGGDGAPTSTPTGPWLPDAAALDGVTVRSDPARAGGLFSAPVPASDLWQGGRAAVAGWPNPNANDYVAGLLDIIGARHDGFPLTAGIFFALTGAIDAARLPDPLGSTRAEARVFLMAVEPGLPERGQRHPVDCDFRADAGPYGAPNLLTLLPFQGRPLRPLTRYAAVVLRSLEDADGAPLGRPAMVADLLAGRPIPALDDAARADYDVALAALREAGVAPEDIAGVTVFRTGDPAAELGAFVADARARGVPAPGPFTLDEVHEDFCVFSATTTVTTYQHGTPPYQGGFDAGGAWQISADGAPTPYGPEPARLVVTIPRGPAPAGGFPPLVFIRTGAGGDRPLVDRGVRDAQGQVLLPATGPAWNLARAGFAGVMIDGPHGGPRNVSQGDEQFLMFNITNPWAMRDNVRESALELALMADVVAGLAIDTGACPGSDPVTRLDMSRLALMGHSMGGWLAPMVLAVEPRYRAVVLSGAGGSWIENVIYKQHPIPPKPFAEAVLGYDDREVHSHDPALTLLQWAVESADPAAYVDLARAHGAHVLMVQGIVDGYILPPIANTTSLGLGLDLAGPELDDTGDARLAGMRPLGPLLALAGRQAIPLPAAGNDGDGALTRVVVQHLEDGVEDGHEVIFQTPGAKLQYRCFLASFAATGLPRVPIAGGEWDPCPP